MQKLRRSYLHLITLCVSLCIAAPVFAQPHAEVGYLYPDGTLYIDLDRFQPTLAVDGGNTLPVDTSTLSVKDGMVYLLRVADDQCTSEYVQLYLKDTVPDTFDPIASQIPAGTYSNGSQMGPGLPPGGPIFAVETTLSLTAYFTRCHDTGCGNIQQDAFCHRQYGPGIPPCACVWSEYTVDGLPGLGHSNSGCTLGMHLRPDWGLPDSVRTHYIQNP